MKVTINIDGQALSVEVTVEVYEYLDRASHKEENHAATIRRWANADKKKENPPDLAHARSYDRILERCAPVLFSGKNLREEGARATKAAAKEIVSKG